MILPGFEDAVEEDLRLINAGMAIRTNNTYEINGRTYREHGGTGTAYPLHGDGFRTIDRSTHTCLVKFARYNGITEEALNEIAHDPNIHDVQRDDAISLWELRGM